jgi:hypothetical protein
MKATVGLAALSATTATAIMIPSTVSVPELSSLPNLKTTGVEPRSELMKVECAGCMFAQKDASDRLTWTQGVENALVLNISVGAQPETLELNGVRFYPPVMSMALENPVPYIPQIPAEMSLVEIRASAEKLAEDALRLTSWAFQAGTSQTISESGEELLTIHLQLNALERQTINVPDIAITTLKNTDGETAILWIEIQDKEQVEMQECEDWPLLCKWREIIAAKLSGFKGFKPHFGVGAFGKAPCAESGKGGRPDGKHGWHPHGPPHYGDDEHDHPHGPPGKHHGGPPPGWKHHGPPGKEHHGPPHGGHGWHHHGPHHGHHMQHNKFHRTMHMIGRVMLTVFVPILLGVAAGMVTYLLGMLIGAVVAAVYMKIRGRKARYQAVALEEEDFEIDDDEETVRGSMEKDGFKDEEVGEAPPVYVEKE